MNLSFEKTIADQYVSNSQRARVLSEDWLHSNAYCPCCGSLTLMRYANNHPAADFFCSQCGEEFELKSTHAKFGSKIVDGAYKAMILKIQQNVNPNFLLLSYDRQKLYVTSLVIIPKHFFYTSAIEQRKPLGDTARRKGWVGCNIRLDAIPESGRISLVRDGVPSLKKDVIAAWRRMVFLRAFPEASAKGWLVAVINLIEALGKSQFALSDVYELESHLQLLFPDNHNVRAKVRQQMQILRDRGYLKFLGNGIYCLVDS